jgi:hypothetical protein
MRTSSNSQPTDSKQMALFQTSSAAAILASRFHTQVIDEAKRMIDISGRSLFPLLRDSDPLGAFSKMCMGTSLWGSMTYSMTWKAKATPRGRLFFQLSPSMRSTAGIESGSSQEMWPTPTTMTGGQGVAPSYVNGKHGWNLGAAVNDSESETPHRLWPTPTQDSASDRTEKYAQGGMPLTVAVKLWPTPTVQDSNKATKRWREDHQNNLTAAVFNPHRMFPTPIARDAKGGYRTESLIRKDGKSRAMDSLSNAVLDGKGTETASGHLNPEWVEWLMGYKIGHTELKDWATQSSRKSSRKSEKLLEK